MKKILIAGFAAAAFCGAPALAADLPVKAAPAPLFSWTGWYGGFNVGGDWGRTRQRDLDGWDCTGCVNTVRPDGINGGVQLGYNWQSGSFVAGIEGDVGYLGFHGNHLDTSPVITPDTRTIARGGFDATIRGRLGIAADRSLLYLTGGAIFADVGAGVFDNSTVNTPGLLNLTQRTGMQTGWVLGGGYEYAFSNQWSLKLEYLHFDLGSKTITEFSPPAGNFRFDVKTNGDIVRVGLNYKFGDPWGKAPVVAKY
jgi:outer membrane immunogenic protein